MLREAPSNIRILPNIRMILTDVVRGLANVLCLCVGIWYVGSTHDILGFILLYGIATGAINAREVAGKLLPGRRKGE